MAASTIVCPRCGARDSFRKGYLPDTCVCLVCQSQLDYKEIPGCGPSCVAVDAEPNEKDENAARGGKPDGGTKY